MKKILPDKRIIWMVAVLVVIAIPLFSKFREIRQAPPQQLLPSTPKTNSEIKQPESLRIQQGEEPNDVREHKLQEADRQFLVEQGLRNPTNDLVTDLMKHNELIPCEGSVGGSPGFYNADRIAVVSKDHVIADYDDGHVEGTVELAFIVSHGTISWTVVKSECGN